MSQRIDDGFVIEGVARKPALCCATLMTHRQTHAGMKTQMFCPSLVSNFLELHFSMYSDLLVKIIETATGQSYKTQPSQKPKANQSAVSRAMKKYFTLRL